MSAKSVKSKDFDEVVSDIGFKMTPPRRLESVDGVVRNKVVVFSDGSQMKVKNLPSGTIVTIER